MPARTTTAGIEGTASPIFVLCCERSGSTLVRYILDAHPEICCPGELHLGRTSASWYHSVFHGPLQSRPISQAKRHRLAVAETRQMISQLMSRYALDKGKPIWCEKSVLTIDFLGLLAEVFPDARYLCLYRNCLDTIHSALEACRLGWWPGIKPFVERTPDNFPDGLADFWLSKIGRILSFEQAHPGQCYRLRYEDVVQRPERTLREVFAFLGVTPAPGLHDRVFQTAHDDGPGDPKIRSSRRIEPGRVGTGAGLSDQLSSERIELINVVHGAIGYPAINLRRAGHVSSRSS